MQPNNTIIILVHRQTEADKQVAEIIIQELQNRGVQDICLIADENQEAGSSPEQRAAALLKGLEEKNLLPSGPQEEEVYTEEEAEKIKKRLEDLGYL
jgi:DNA-binding LacI/PurR family transcriptional regulator